VDFYHLTPGRARTRSEQIYIYLRSEPGAGATAVGRPVLVSRLTPTSICYLGFGTSLVSGPSRPSSSTCYVPILRDFRETRPKVCCDKTLGPSNKLAAVVII